MQEPRTVWGINLTHDGAICQVTDGEVDWFLEEERVSRRKHDTSPTCLLDYAMTDVKNSQWIVTGLVPTPYQSIWDTYYTAFCVAFDKIHRKRFMGSPTASSTLPKIVSEDHHIFHAGCAYHNSGFDDAVVVVVDGMGNPVKKDSEDATCHEVESIYNVIDGSFQCIWKTVTPTFVDCDRPYPDLPYINQKAEMGIGMVHQAMSVYYGFGELGSGTLMGLAGYGKFDPLIKPFLKDPETIDESMFHRVQYGAKFIPYDYVKFDGKFEDLDRYHEKFEPLCNLAWRIQKDFEIYMTHLLKRCVEHTKCNNLILTGGCALNCVANYEYLKHLPKDVNLYIEPVSSDAGTAMGAAYMAYEYDE